MLVQEVAKPRVVQFALFIDQAFIPEVLWKEPVTARIPYAFVTVHAALYPDDILRVTIGPSGAEWFDQTFTEADISRPGLYAVAPTGDYAEIYRGEDWRLSAVYTLGGAEAAFSSVMIGFVIIPIGMYVAGAPS